MKLFLRNIFVCGACLLSFVSCNKKEETIASATQKANLVVEGEVVLPRYLDHDLKLNADLLANEQVELKAPLSGSVLAISFKEGQKVQKGDLILRLDDRIWKTELLGVNAELENAKKNLGRKIALLEIEGSTQEEIDALHTAIQLMEVRKQQLQVNIQLANITAPFSGVLGMRNISVGAYLKEGETITWLADRESLKVNFYLPEVYQSDMKIGKEVYVVVKNDTLKAQVYAVNPLVDANSRTVQVRALLKQQGKKILFPGTFAEVIVASDIVENALLVAAKSVVPEINEQTVYVYKSGKAVRRVVKLGHRTKDEVHIESGVQAGDTVITTGLLQVKDGVQVSLKALNKQ